MTEPTGPNPFASDPLAQALPSPPPPAPDPTGANPYTVDPLAAKPFIPPPPVRDVYRGSILPLSRDAQGNVSFDPWGAGPIGAIRQAFTLPGRVQSGEVQVDPSNPAFIGETLNFAGAFGPSVNPAIRSGDRVIPGVVRNAPDPRSVPTPSWQDLLNKGGQQLENYKNAPVLYNPDYAPVLAQQLETKLINEGVFEHEAPGLYAAIQRLRNNQPPLPGDEVLFTPANIHSIRKNIAAQFGKPGEDQHGVGVAFQHFNDFTANPPPGAVLAGPAAEAAAEFNSGLGNYAAGMRGQGLDNIKRTADLKNASANSGQNPDNSLRSRITSHILDARKVRGYTPEEVAMLEAIPVGSTANNILRGASNVLGGGGGSVGAGAAGAAAYGLGSLFGFGPAASATFAAAAPIAGNVLRRMAGKGTREALDDASIVMRQRSPMFQEQLNAFGAPRDPGRDALARALLRTGSQAGQGVPVDQPTTDYSP